MYLPCILPNILDPKRQKETSVKKRSFSNKEISYSVKVLLSLALFL